MKFDLVIGNPPFQKEVNTSSSRLWPQFIKKSFDVVTNNGIVSLITPHSWMGGTASNVGGTTEVIIEKYLTNNQTEAIFTSVGECFEGVGCEMTAFVSIKKECNNTTTFIDNNMNFNADIKGMTFLPKILNQYTISIAKKIEKKGKTITCKINKEMVAEVRQMLDL